MKFLNQLLKFHPRISFVKKSCSIPSINSKFPISRADFISQIQFYQLQNLIDKIRYSNQSLKFYRLNNFFYQSNKSHR